MFTSFDGKSLGFEDMNRNRSQLRAASFEHQHHMTNYLLARTGRMPRMNPLMHGRFYQLKTKVL